MAYKESVPFYDLFASENDIPYYEKSGMKHGRALEITMGIVRVALELAKACVEIRGINDSRLC